MTEETNDTNVVSFEKKTIVAEGGVEEPPTPTPPTPEPDPIERDILNKQGAKFVTDGVLGPLQSLGTILNNIGNMPTAFRKNVVTALKDFKQTAEIFEQAFRIIEREAADIQLRLHKAYIRFVADTDMRIRQDFTHKFDQQGLINERNNTFNRIRAQEILRLEHSLRTLFYALAEKGIFTEVDEPGEPTPEFLATREENFRIGRDVYSRTSKRVLGERMGLDSKRGTFGEIRLLGGIHTQLYNISDTEVEDYL